MKFENLQNFEWLNEPENVIFSDMEMKIVAKAQTDFWQSKHHNFAKDNGHLFFFRTKNDFNLIVHWKAEKCASFNQCGIMIRIDDKNWFKASLMYQNCQEAEVGSCVTIRGHSDWAGVMLENEPSHISYKLVRKNDDFMVYYSLDGVSYTRLRQFYLDTLGNELKAGAYICSPQENSFEAVLENIEITF